MAKPPFSAHNTIVSDHLQTWILRVYIHCEGCKKKVYKVLQSIDGVYKTVVDAKEHKATVTGSVDGEILVQKLLKSGKHAEILPESFGATAAGDEASGSSKKKKKKKQSNKQNNVVTTADDGENESKGPTTAGSDAGNDQKVSDPAVSGGGDDDNDGSGGGGGGGGKKKKNKKKKGNNNVNIAPTTSDTDGLPAVNPPVVTGATAENIGASMEQLNLGPPMPQMVYSTPYDLPPYSYYPTPAYGVSYSTSYPSAESSYYTPPMYGYAQSHPSVFDPLPPPPPSYRGSAFDDHDVEGGEGRGCTVM